MRKEEDNIKIDQQEVQWGDSDWIYLAHDRDKVGSRECGNELAGLIKCEEFLD